MTEFELETVALGFSQRHCAYPVKSYLVVSFSDGRFGEWTEGKLLHSMASLGGLTLS